MWVQIFSITITRGWKIVFWYRTHVLWDEIEMWLEWICSVIIPLLEEVEEVISGISTLWNVINLILRPPTVFAQEHTHINLSVVHMRETHISFVHNYVCNLSCNSFLIICCLVSELKVLAWALYLLFAVKNEIRSDIANKNRWRLNAILTFQSLFI